ncbi:esterase-like activity of phytase family protein [Actinoplanes sp. NPDC089786]|uniref:esterase-like activity of phytase family protein n=1 Tax=Actinoplanes sp. NPDC089786 TaxID=3155185 RepID=UPI003443D12C
MSGKLPLLAILLLPVVPGGPAAVDYRCSPDVSLRGFSDALDKTTFEGTQVAGLSAISPTTHDHALALVDNIGTTPARVYDITLKRPSVTGVTVLKRADGTPYTGSDFDGEGLVAENRGRTVLASSEREPSIRRFRMSDGQEIASLPVPARFQVAPAGEAAVNQTFEALAAGPDQKVLYAGMEGPLSGDVSGSRIIRYEGAPSYRPVSQYAYKTDSGLGLVELLSLGGDTLMAVERGFTAGVGNTVRLYQVSTLGAADVTNVASLQNLTDPRAWAGKTLLADIVNCPSAGATAKQPQPNPLLDNIEGAALGGTTADGRRIVHLISDDNGGATQITRLYTFAVRVKPDVTLKTRALLSATAWQPGPVSGTLLPPTPVNGITPPFPGQPIPGFSGIIPRFAGDRSGKRLLAMPDNGFGTKANSADFLLRAYDLFYGREITVNGFIGLRDPDRKIPFPIVNQDTADRLLTGADFDLESLQRDARGDLWFGEEFGPFLLRTDETGKVLQAPIPLPDGTRSPQSPYLAPGETPNLPASKGFEAMAVSRDGWTLYPILEGARVNDPDQRRRVVYEFDVRRAAYTGRTWSFANEDASLAVGDAAVLDGRRILLIERDGGMGPASKIKRLIETDLDQVGSDGYLPRRPVVDLMRIADPRSVSLPARPGEYGVGPLFSFPLQSVETVLPLTGNRVLVANDNNFPGNDGRIAGRPDDTEIITIEVPGLRN